MADRLPPSQQRPAGASPLDQAQDPYGRKAAVGAAADRESIEAGRAFQDKVRNAGVGQEAGITDETRASILGKPVEAMEAPSLDREDLDAMHERSVLTEQLSLENRVRLQEIRDTKAKLDFDEALEKALKPIDVGSMVLQGRAEQSVPVLGWEYTALFTTFPSGRAVDIRAAAKRLVAEDRWARPLGMDVEKKKLLVTDGDRRSMLGQEIVYLTRIGNLVCGLRAFGNARPDNSADDIEAEPDRDRREDMIMAGIEHWLGQPQAILEKMVEHYERFLYRCSKACNDMALLTNAGNESSSPLPS